MVRVAAVQEVHMEVQSGVGGKCLKEVLNEAEIEGLDPTLRQIDPIDEIGTAAEIHRDLRQSLVKRDRRPAESADPLFAPERLLQGIADHDPDILDRMMIIDVRIALGLNRQ